MSDEGDENAFPTRATLMTVAGACGVEVPAGGGARELAERIVEALMPNTYRFAGASDHYVRRAYENALAAKLAEPSRRAALAAAAEEAQREARRAGDHQRRMLNGSGALRT